MKVVAVRDPNLHKDTSTSTIPTAVVRNFRGGTTDAVGAAIRTPTRTAIRTPTRTAAMSSNGRAAAATTAPTDTATGTPIRTTAAMGGTRGRAAGEAAAVAAAEAVIGTPRSGTVAAAVAG